MSDNRAKYEILIKQYLHSILDISTFKCYFDREGLPVLYTFSEKGYPFQVVI